MTLDAAEDRVQRELFLAYTEELDPRARYSGQLICGDETVVVEDSETMRAAKIREAMETVEGVCAWQDR